MSNMTSYTLVVGAWNRTYAISIPCSESIPEPIPEEIAICPGDVIRINSRNGISFGMRISFRSDFSPEISMRIDRIQVILILCGYQYVVSFDPNAFSFGHAETDSVSKPIPNPEPIPIQISELIPILEPTLEPIPETDSGPTIRTKTSFFPSLFYACHHKILLHRSMKYLLYIITTLSAALKKKTTNAAQIESVGTEGGSSNENKKKTACLLKKTDYLQLISIVFNLALSIEGPDPRAAVRLSIQPIFRFVI